MHIRGPLWDALKASSGAFGEPTLELLPPVGPPGFFTIAEERSRGMPK